MSQLFSKPLDLLLDRARRIFRIKFRPDVRRANAALKPSLHKLPDAGKGIAGPAAAVVDAGDQVGVQVNESA
jgi:hypothetical protein